jgi:hypothetical protein
LGQNAFADCMKADVIFQKDVAGMVCYYAATFFSTHAHITLI